MRMSAASARFIPPPAAAPFTAAITGWRMVRVVSTIFCPARRSGSSSAMAPRSRASRIAARSPPALKARPAPVSTTTRTSGSCAARSSDWLSAAPNSGLRAFSRSGRFSVSVSTPASRVSSTSGLEEARCAAFDMVIPLSLASRLAPQSLQHLCELAEIAQFVSPADGVLTAGGRQHKHLRPVELLFLQAQLAWPLRKHFENDLHVKTDHAWHKFFDAARRPLHQIRQPDAELDHALVVLILEWLRHNPRIVQERPEQICAPRVIVAQARRLFTGIAANDHQPHSPAKIIRQRAHLCQIHPNALDLRVVLQGVHAKFAAVAAHFVAAEGGRSVVIVVRVDPHGSGLELARDAVRFSNVARPDGCGEPILRFIRETDGLVHFAKLDCREHRAEDFLAGDGHVVADTIEDRGLNKTAFPIAEGGAFAAGNQLGTLSLPLLDVAEHGVHLPLADQCAEAGLGIERVAGLDFIEAVYKLVHEIVVDFLFDKKTRACRADFALTVENSDGRAAHRGVQIGIGKNDVRRLAAELEGYAFQGVGRVTQNFLARSRFAGDGHLGHLRMLHQALPPPPPPPRPPLPHALR